jgi:hypothetical protein
MLQRREVVDARHKAGHDEGRPATSSLVLQRHTKPASQILHKLPRDAA